MLSGGWEGLCAITSPVPGEQQPQLTVHRTVAATLPWVRGVICTPGWTRSLRGRWFSNSCDGQEGLGQQRRLGAPTVSSSAWISSSRCNDSGSFRKLLALIKDSKGWRIYSPLPHKLVQHLIKFQIKKTPHALFSSVKLADGCFQPWVSLCVSWCWECSCIKHLLGKMHHLISYHSPL